MRVRSSVVGVEALESRLLLSATDSVHIPELRPAHHLASHLALGLKEGDDDNGGDNNQRRAAHHYRHEPKPSPDPHPKPAPHSGPSGGSGDTASSTSSSDSGGNASTNHTTSNSSSTTASTSISSSTASGPFTTGSAVDAGFVAESVLSLSNGKLLVIGHKGDVATGQSQGVIERLNSGGAIDTSFASHGQIVTGTGEAFYAGALPDTKHFLVVGSNSGDFVLRRYNLNGSIDTTFGSSGTVITDFGTANDVARAIAIGADGTIVVGGDSGGNFAFARYQPNGQLDPNFAQGGLQLFALGAGNNGLGDIALQSDGKILAVGAEGANVVAVRLTSAGEADGSFGSGGLAIVKPLAARTDLGVPDTSEALAITSDGGILVGNRTSTDHFGLVRLNSTGGVDNSFGAAGLAIADFGGDDDADSILVQTSGTIVVIGTSLTGQVADTAIAEFDSIGLPINSFGNAGLLTMPSGFSTTATAQSSSSATPTKALHIGDIVLRAFGALTSNGGIIIGTSNEAIAATTSSKLRRLVVPGAVLSGNSSGTLLGMFGIVNGKPKKLTASDNGVSVTFSLRGGTAAAYQNGKNIDIVVDDTGRGVALSLRSASNISLGQVTVSGTLRSLSARNSTLAGSLHVTGSIGRMAFGDVTGNIYSGSSIAGASAGNVSGTIFAAEAIGRLKLGDVSGVIAAGGGIIGGITCSSLSNGKILSGVNLGNDGVLGGGDDSYVAGSIGALRVGGAITSSFVGAGVNPVDGTFGNGDDKSAGSTPSVIHLLVAPSADSASRFEATSFGPVRLGSLIDVQNDPRFRLLS